MIVDDERHDLPKGTGQLPEFLNKRTAITAEQLDEMERKAKAVQDACAAGQSLRRVFDEYVEANSPDVTLQLVAIARAALAWRDARLARQAVQTRAGLAETSDEHHAAMRELPAVKEADVIACMDLMSALGPP